MPVAYLAGAMEFATDGGKGWRVEMTEWLREVLGHEVLDPTVLEHDQLSEEEALRLPALRRGDFAELRPIAQRIIRYDLGLIRHRCDYIICYWNEAAQRGCGTGGELTVAQLFGKPVHMVLDYPRERVSTWMVGCTTSIHDSWDNLRAHLVREFRSESDGNPSAQAAAKG